MLEAIIPVLLGLLKGLLPADWTAGTKDTIASKLALIIANIADPERREVEVRVAAAQLAAGEIPAILRGRDE